VLLHDSGFVLQQLYNFGGLFGMPSEQPFPTVGEDVVCGLKLDTLDDISNGFAAPPEDTRILEEQLLSMTDSLSV
jgi:hypothetical protein